MNGGMWASIAPSKSITASATPGVPSSSGGAGGGGGGGGGCCSLDAASLIAICAIENTDMTMNITSSRTLFR